MKFCSVFILLISFSILSCNGQPTINIQTIAPEAFAKKIAETPKAQILDVRTPEEFASEHIDNAVNINWLGDNFVSDAEKLDKSKPVFVYCKSGARSAKASVKLVELGFKNIYTLDGGMIKWNAAGLSKPSDKIIGMCSQEYAELLNTDKKVLIDFNAKWCAPCKKMAPYLDKMQKEMTDKVVIIRLDADENKTLISEMKIDELPTLILYENKEIKWKHSGYISEEDLKKQLQ
ncbi:thioredoxin domain-containing protein [Flavobacterium soyangense]|uniref:Thioredoxin fold domain-containing protein n=1 Tax=Flavobacterium soyangense TaxID=2023265 RepID=A0A930XVM9_9FLAO|nr:thioredoxin domain-containing protein [Flavobacterium soyangense]MBF2708287.1 thioredoxin fold domain-containing protein [Flavobacterium soyangense]